MVILLMMIIMVMVIMVVVMLMMILLQPKTESTSSLALSDKLGQCLMKDFVFSTLREGAKVNYCGHGDRYFSLVFVMVSPGFF